MAESRELTVRVFARRWIDETLSYRSPEYVAQIVGWLDAYIVPVIGDMQLSQVQPGDVLKIIKARADTPVTAERIRVIVQQFYNHAIRNLIGHDEPGAAAARSDRPRSGQAPPPPEREGTGRVLAQARSAGRPRHDHRGEQAVNADDGSQERTASIEVARVRSRRGAMGSVFRAHEAVARSFGYLGRLRRFHRLPSIAVAMAAELNE